LATLTSIPQLLAALGGARGAMAQEDVLQNLAINLGAVTIFGLLLRRELQARDKQLARLQREERLGALRLRLASGKVLQLSELRGSIRAVVVAGTQQQVGRAPRAGGQLVGCRGTRRPGAPGRRTPAAAARRPPSPPAPG
jgi:hypothetical protein